MITNFVTFLRRWSWELMGAVLFGVLVWLCLPDRVVTIDDDYGYLRSIQETMQKGRPWTNEFLVPYAVTTTLMTCGLYALFGGSMVAGVHGSLALAAAVTYGALAAILRLAGVKRWLTAVMAVLVLTGPTVFFMLLMFTSVPVYWAALLGCVVAGATRRWGWFTVAFVLGMATRQSALVWLAVPGWVLVVELWKQRANLPRVKVPWGPVVAIVVGLATVVALRLGMNATNGQRVAHEAMSRMPGGGWLSFLGVFSIMGGFGWASLLKGLGDGDRVRGVMWLPALVVAGLGAWLAVWGLGNLNWSHNCYNDVWAKSAIGVMGAAAGLGLVLYPRKPWWPALWAGIGAWAPQLVYVSGFDYYYIETFLWGLAAALFGMKWSVRSAAASGVGWSSFVGGGLVRLVGAALAVTLLAWNARCVVKHKLSQDRVSAFCQVYEKAMDEGLLQPHEVGFCPFGYAGWLFDEYYLAGGGVNPGGFMQYSDDWDGTSGTGVLTFYPKSFKEYRAWLPSHSSAPLREHPQGISVTSVDVKVLWFWKAKFEIRQVKRENDAPRADVVPLDYAKYEREKFPLNDAEWRRLMAGDKSLGRTEKVAATEGR